MTEDNGVSKKNIELWKDVIEDDRQWDFTFLEKIILHKVKLMREFYINGHSSTIQESVDKKIEEMTIVIEALERLLADDYIHFPEGKEPKISFSPSETTKGLSVLNINHHPDFDSEKVDNVYRKAEEEMLNDRALVYDTLRDKSPNWWD